MKKALFLIIFLLVPSVVTAEAMLRPVNDSTIQYQEAVSNTNTGLDLTNDAQTIVNVEIDLPDLKLIPSSPLYFIKTWWETARGWFMVDVVKKAEYRISLANRRLEEIEVLAQKQKTEVINETTDRFNEQMAKANAYIEKAKSKGKDLENVYRLLEENMVKHQIAFGQISDNLPQEAKLMIEKAKTLSQDSFKNAKEKIKSETKEEINEGIDVLQEKINNVIE